MKTILISSLFFLTAFVPRASADFWGADIPILAQILVQATAQVRTTIQMLGQARDTVSILQEMNRGVKEVLRLADTAHIPLPPQVYENAKKIDQAAETAQRLYGIIGNKSPAYTKSNYKSGVEGLFLSEDAFEYSTFLDDQGNKVKAASIVSSQATATRLTAETLGVLLHAVSHGNRIEAKQLELSSTKRIEDTSKDNANYETFIETQTSIENEMKKNVFSSLNNITSGSK
jgi:hypothetical protein